MKNLFVVLLNNMLVDMSNKIVENTSQFISDLFSFIRILQKEVYMGLIFWSEEVYCMVPTNLETDDFILKLTFQSQRMEYKFSFLGKRLYI